MHIQKKCLYLSFNNKRKPKQIEIMKTYNYTYYGATIQKSRFEQNVPKDWEKEYDTINGYSYGGYRAVEVENKYIKISQS